jgi:hypothetical protein
VPAAVVGVRVVPREFVRRVCRWLGGGIALTSANLSGAESSLCTADFRYVACAPGCVCVWGGPRGKGGGGRREEGGGRGEGSGGRREGGGGRGACGVVYLLVT